MDIKEVLRRAIDGKVDSSVRAAALAQLQTAARDHFVPYVGMLVETLADINTEDQTRMVAALALKNELTAKSQRTRHAQAERWSCIDAAARAQVKQAALKTLETQVEPVANAAAQLVAAIADIELPLGEWPELPGILVESTRMDRPVNIKRASLVAIGYICESADPSNPMVTSHMDGFLTAIIQGAQKSEPNDGVRLTALNALVNSLEFIRRNFAQDNERNYIMQVVCEATQASSTELQSAAFGALSRIMSLYYIYMRPYMEAALFQLTIGGMQHEDEGVACMALEFWSTVCEEEMVMPLEGPHASQDFALQALTQILPVVLKLLLKQDEDADEDEWGLAMAAGSCLQLLAQDVRDAVVEPVIQFVAANIQSTEWAQREAAVMAFGSILDGPDMTQLRSLIRQALQPLLVLMHDYSTQVKDTVAWCLGRIADLAIDALDLNQDLPSMMQVLMEGLGDDPKVVTHCCWTIMNIVEQLSPILVESNTMSQYYPELVRLLVEISARPDNEHSCRTSAYEALSSLVICSPEDVQPLVMTLSGTVVERLQQVAALQGQVVGTDDRQNVEELQINLLGLLTNIIRRVGERVLPAAEQLMQMLIHFLEHKFADSLIEEDLYICIGTVAGCIGPAFAPYAPVVVPYIVQSLKETELPAATTAVGLVADLSHALGIQIIQYVSTFMSEFAAILSNPDVRQDLRPPILSCIGDVASAVGEQGFEPYLDGVEQLMLQAASVQITPETSLETADYIVTLREAILDAHVGIVAGLRDSPGRFAPFVPNTLAFIKMVVTDVEMPLSESLIRSAVGVVGDIASMYPSGEFKQFFVDEWVTELIKRARSTEFSKSTLDSARWARDQQKKQLAV